MNFLRKNQFYILIGLAVVVLYPIIKDKLNKAKSQKTAVDTAANYYGQVIDNDLKKNNPVI